MSGVLAGDQLAIDKDEDDPVVPLANIAAFLISMSSTRKRHDAV